MFKLPKLINCSSIASFSLSETSNRNNLLFDRNAVLLNRIAEPVWINVKTAPFSKSSIDSQTNSTLKSQIFNSKNSCDSICLAEGLLFTQTIGDAAKDGYNAVFFNENFKSPTTILPNMKNGKSNLKNVVMTFFKNFVGKKVFNLKTMKIPFIGKTNVHMYGYCSKHMKGAMTLMGINYSSNRGKINLRGLSAANQNIVALQYLLSVSDGQILLNNEKINQLDSITPIYKFKKSGKNSLILTLPPNSIGFWNIKNLKNMECFVQEDTGPLVSSEQELPVDSSTDLLLKHLLKGIFNHTSNEAHHVQKRSITSSESVNRQLNNLIERDLEKSNSKKIRKHRVRRQYLPGPFDFFNLDLPEFPKFPTFKPQPIPVPEIPNIAVVTKKPDIFNGNAKESIPDMYKLSDAENIFKSSENTNLPDGDIHMSLSAGKDFTTQQATLDTQKSKARKTESGKKIKAQQHQFQMLPASKEAYAPYDYLEAYSKANIKPAEKKQNPEPKTSELYEAEQVASYKHPNANAPSQNPGTNNVELQMIVKDLEPTHMQSKSALLAAKKKLENMRIMEVLENGELKEISKDDLNPSEMLKIADLTDSDFETVGSSEEFDDADEEFFKMDEPQRNKRSVLTNEVLDDSEGHDFYFDIDTFNHGDEEFVRPPSYILKFDIPKNYSEVENTTEVQLETSTLVDDILNGGKNSSLTIKAVNYFGETVNNVVTVLQKSFMGWWNLFTKPTEDDS